MPTQLQVYNAALDLLGERSVAAVDETSTGAIVLERQWDFAITEVLRAYPWNWAKKRVTLDEASPAPSSGWDHRYVMPTDYVTGLTVNEDDAFTDSDFFEIEGAYLHTDEDEVILEYIAKPDDSSSGVDAEWTTDAMLGRMDPLAMNALITLLAAKIAPKLTKDGGAMADALLARYYNSDIVKARYRNIAERKKPPMSPPNRSAWDSARTYSTNG